MKKKATWLLSVVLTAALMNSLLSPALALFSRMIQVQSGIDFYVNDTKLTPKDSNGNPIEGLMYNDYTYLPVRAISEALNVPILWDGDTQSVYIGKHVGIKPAARLKDFDIYDWRGSWWYDNTSKNNLGYTYEHSLQLKDKIYDGYITYKLNGRYNYLVGLYYQLYDYRNSANDESTLSIYTDGKLAWRATVGPGIDPIKIDLNVQGVQEVKFHMSYYGYQTAIGELGLWA